VLKTKYLEPGAAADNGNQRKSPISSLYF